MTAPVLSVVIPAFNEADNVRPVVDETCRFLDGESDVRAYELILVNDGSSDGTAAVMNALQGPRVKVVHHRTNQGFGAALRSGYTAATGQFVTLITGDGEIGIDQAVALLRELRGGDLIISRRVRPVDSSRTLFSTVFGWFTRALVGADAAEMSGIYVIRRDVLQAMPLRSSTGVVNFEVVLRARRRGCTIKAGTTNVRPRLSGSSKVTNVRTMLRVLRELVKLRLQVASEPHGQSVRRG